MIDFWEHWPWILSLLIILVPLALTGFFYSKFTSKDEALKAEKAAKEDRDRIEKALRDEIEEVRSDHHDQLIRLEASIVSKLDGLEKAFVRYQDKQEARVASLDQLNGLGRRMDERYDDLKERIQDTATQAQLAFNIAQTSNTGVQHLTQRLEEVIGNAITRLEKEMEKLSKAISKFPQT